jgi:hypothetical protein
VRGRKWRSALLTVVACIASSETPRSARRLRIRLCVSGDRPTYGRLDA